MYLVQESQQKRKMNSKQPRSVETRVDESRKIMGKKCSVPPHRHSIFFDIGLFNASDQIATKVAILAILAIHMMST